jgi:DNA-binding GntR family transcriptional regulator
MGFTDAERAYIQIKNMIVTLQLAPGSVIDEGALMIQLGYGRTPIREALKRLQADNLVLVRAHRGMFVADIAITDLGQIFEFRSVIEPLGVRLAAQRITEEQMERLRSLVREYEMADKTDKACLLYLDYSFHNLFSEACQNKYLQYELETLQNLSTRIWNLAVAKTTPEDINIDSHVDILKAIEEGDAYKAESIMKDHIDLFHERIKEYL